MENCGCIFVWWLFRILFIEILWYAIFPSRRNPKDYPISLDYSGDSSGGVYGKVLPQVKGEYRGKAYTLRRTRGWKGSIFEVSMPLEPPSTATILIKLLPYLDLKDYRLRYTHEKNMEHVTFDNPKFDAQVYVSSTQKIFASELLDENIQAQIAGLTSGIITIHGKTISFLDRGLFFKKSNRAERIFKLLHSLCNKMARIEPGRNSR